MSDIYGMSTALRGAFAIVAKSMRKSGRTKHMLDHLRPWDTVLLADANEAQRLRHLIDQANNQDTEASLHSVRIIVVNPNIPDSVAAAIQSSNGRVILDHGFVELYWDGWIQRGAEHLKSLTARGDRCYKQPPSLEDGRFEK